MKTRRLLIPFAFGLGLVLALLWLLGITTPVARAVSVLSTSENQVSLSSGDIITVCLSGGCDYTTIQAAVAAASDMAVIKVAAGTYTDVHAIVGEEEIITQVVYVDKTVTIQGGYTTDNWTTPDPDANPTTLDAQGRGRALYIAGRIAPVIEGLRITGGYAAEDGGGVHVIQATATLSDNHVFGNTASHGGGLYLRASAATLRGNTVASNTADFGGGLYLQGGDAKLSGNTIYANTAITAGGGLLLWLNDKATLSGNTFTVNVAKYGGGLCLHRSDAALTNNVVVDNQASDAGSGLYIWGSSPRLLHTTIARNAGGEGSGVYITDYKGTYSNVGLVNTIVAIHKMGINVTAGNGATLNGTLWYGNTGGDHGGDGAVNAGTRNYWGNPNFLAPDAGDYHISATSAAVDKVLDIGAPVDMDGDQRPRGNGYDIGADELPSPLSVVIQASPIPVKAGEQLTYTIRVANFGVISLTATITNILPSHVTPTGVRTWATNLVPGDDWRWTQQVIVTVEAGYRGLLTSTVYVTTDEGETGAGMLVVGCYAVYLPLTLRNH